MTSPEVLDDRISKTHGNYQETFTGGACGVIGVYSGMLISLIAWPGSNLGPAAGMIFGLPLGSCLGLIIGFVMGVSRVLTKKER